MGILMNLLLPVLWLFMGLEWIYKKLRAFVCRTTGEQEPQRKRKGNRPGNRPCTTDTQREIALPEQKLQTDEGMKPRERTLPYIPLPEPTKEQKPEPVKKKPPEFIFEPPKERSLKTKKNGRELRDRGRG